MNWDQIAIIAQICTGGAPNEELNRLVPKFASKSNIHIVVAGSQAGKFSAIFEEFSNRIGLDSTVTSKKIEK